MKKILVSTLNEKPVTPQIWTNYSEVFMGACGVCFGECVNFLRHPALFKTLSKLCFTEYMLTLQKEGVLGFVPKIALWERG